MSATIPVSRRLPVVLVACVLALSACESPAPAIDGIQSDHEPIESVWTPDGFFDLTQFASVSVSPEGDQVAFQADTFDVGTNVWNHQVFVTAQNAEVIPLADMADGATAPQWSPDGSRVAYLAAPDGLPQLWASNPDGTGQFHITSLETPVMSFAWSPDSRRIAFTTPDQASQEETAALDLSDAVVAGEHVRQIHLWVVSVTADASPARLTGGDFSVGSFDWSPDGTDIAFCHAPTPTDTGSLLYDISVLDTVSGSISPIASGPEGYVNPLFSHEGSQLAFVQSDAENAQFSDYFIRVADLEDGDIRDLAVTDNQYPTIVGWSRDDTMIYYEEAVGTELILASIPAEGGSPRRESDEAIPAITAVTVNASGTTFGFVGSAPDQPFEVYTSSTTRWNPLPMTSFNEVVAERPVGKTEVVRWTADDGEEVEGLLTYPVDYEAGSPVPTLTYLHGGPRANFAQTFVGGDIFYPIAAFSESGYAVFRPNVRGSDGRGSLFRRGTIGDWGGRDFDDLMTGIDHLVDRGVADPDALGIMGWSYGGYLTAWTITQTDRFRAASIGAGPVDLVAMTASDLSDLVPQYLGPHWEDYDIYVERSPIAHVAGIDTPTLIQHGTDDGRVPITQALELYNALAERGIPVELVQYPRGGHAVLEPTLMRDVLTRNFEWFTEWIPVKEG